MRKKKKMTNEKLEFRTQVYATFNLLSGHKYNTGMIMKLHNSLIKLQYIMCMMYYILRYLVQHHMHVLPLYAQVKVIPQ